MPPGLGRDAYAQMGKETTYATYATPTSKLEIISEGIEPDIGAIDDPSLHSGVSLRGLFEGGKLYRGPIVYRATFEGILELLRGIFGGYTSALVETGVRDHTFKEAASLFSYSIDLAKGNIPAGKVFRILGAKYVPGTIFRVTAGQGNDAMLQIEANVLAKDKLSNQNAGASLAFPPVLPILFHSNEQAGAVMDDGTADAIGSVRVRSVEVSLEQEHSEDRWFMLSKNIDEPLRINHLRCRWRITQEFTTQTQFDLARTWAASGAEPSPRIVFQHPTTIGAASKREFELRSNKCQIVGYSNPVAGPGIIISTVTYAAFLDATDSTALLCRVRNTEAALT